MRHLREFVTLLQLADIPLKQGELMCRHTSFQIGGPVTLMVFPTGADQLRDIFELCGRYEVKPVILGAGSNMLAPDEGLDTVIIETRTNMTEISDLGGGLLEAQSGVTLARLATFAMEQGLTGLEFAHGIPGTLGGGVYMNAGAYGGEMAGVLVSVTVMTPDGTVQELSLDELGLSYRHSRFMEEDAMILGAKLKLRRGGREEIKGRMAELMAKRRTSQPLEFPSAGSTFKRPATGYAAALIEAAGLKGRTVGGAQVSEKHAGFVINRGRATCKDVLALMKEIQNTVQEASGVMLEPEVQILEVTHRCDF
jgi:UDP-N-acetylmuramate dehydrogenase